MSTVDQRIVEMRFDNEQFERGVKETLKSLDKLKVGLDIDSSTKSLSNLEKAINNVTFDKIGDSAVRTTESFSLLYRVGSEFLERLANSAVDAGIKMAKSLSIDNITAGFSKYEQQSKAVQMILNNTEATVQDTEDLIDKLMWYTDETSYSFDAMISNIGKFTGAGIDLDLASKGMIGLANACGLAGVETSMASHAMEGFSKAMAQGYMDNRNWSWVRTARLDTKQFKQQLIDTAEQMGVLKRDTKGILRDANKTEVTFENFQTTLADKWLTKDVMTQALAEYSEYTEAIYEIAMRENISASEAMEQYAEEVESLGQKSFKAAQEARTFTDAIEATKDAVSSKFSRMFSLLFGNYEEAKTTWTNLSVYLWDVFAYPLQQINDSLRIWKKSGGFEMLFAPPESGDQGAFYNYLDAIYAYTDAFNELNGAFFFDHKEGELSNFAQAFLDLSIRVKEASESFEVSDEALERFATGIQRVYSVIKSGFTILSAIGTYIGKTIRLLKEGVNEIMPDLDSMIGDTVTSLADFAANLKKAANEFEYSEATVERVRQIFRGAFTIFSYGVRVLKGLWTAAKKVFDYLEPAAQKLGEAFDYALPYIEQFLNYIGEQISAFETWAKESDIVQSTITFFVTAFNKAKIAFGEASKFFSAVFENMANAIQELTGYDIRTITWETILDLLRRIGEVLQPIIPLLWDGVQAIGAFIAVLASDAITAASEKIAKLIGKLDEFKQNISASTANKKTLIRTFINDIKNGKLSISKYIKNLQIVKKLQEIIQNSKDKIAKLFENFSLGGAILSALGGSLIYLNLAFGDMASSIAGFFAGIAGVSTAMSKFLKSLSRAKMLKAAVLGLVTVLAALTAAIGYLSYVARQEGGIEALNAAFDIIWKSIAVMAAFAVVIGIFSSLKTGKTFTASFFALAAFVAALGLLIFSLVELKGMGDEDILSGIWPVFAVIGLVAILMLTIAKLGKGATWGGGMWQVIAFAGAVYILVEALANLRHLEFNYKSIGDLLHQLAPLITIMMSLALLLTAVGGMRIRGTIAFVLFLKVIRLLIEDLDALSKITNPSTIQMILNSVTGLVGVIGAFVLLSQLFKKISGAPTVDKSGKLLKLFGIFAALVLAFIGISYAFSLLANAEKNASSITGIMITVTVFIVAMLGISALVGKAAPTIMKGVAMFVGLAGAVLLLALAVIAISYAPSTGIWQTISVIAVLGLIAVGLAWLSTKIKGVSNIGFSILALASSVLILALGLMMLDGIDLSKIGNQLALLTVAFGFLILMGSLGRGARGAPKSILALAASVLILALALAALSFLPDENLERIEKVAWAIGGLIAVFALVVWAASQMPEKGVLGPLIAMVVGLGLIIAALFILADKPWQGLMGAAGALAIALIGLALSMLILSSAAEKISGLDILGMGLGMGVLAASLYVVALAIKQLEGINFWQMAGSVVVLVLALAGIAAVMWAVGKYGALYAIFGAAAFIILAGALLILTAAALAVWDAFSGGNHLDTWINGLRNTIDGTSKVLAESDAQTDEMNAVSQKREEANERYEEAMAGSTGSGGGAKPNTNRLYNANKGNRIIKGLQDYTDNWVNGKILNGRTVEQLEAQFVDPESGMWATVAAGSGADAAKTAGEANGESFASGAIGAITNGLTDGLQQAFQGQDLLSVFAGSGSAEGEGTQWLSAVASGASIGGVKVGTTVQEVADSANQTLEEAATNAVESGKNFAEGFANGIDANSDLAKNYASALGQAALQALRDAIAEGSPSKLTYLSGGYFEEGFSNAINDYAYRSANAARALGQETYDALGEGLGRMDGIANGTIRTAPTIRPVLDTRALQNGSRSLDTMFASRQAMYANIADQERRNADDMYQLVDVAYAILGAVTSGHDLYLDGNKLVGRINRGLGKR